MDRMCGLTQKLKLTFPDTALPPVLSSSFAFQRQSANQAPGLKSTSNSEAQRRRGDVSLCEMLQISSSALDSAAPRFTSPSVGVSRWRITAEGTDEGQILSGWRSAETIPYPVCVRERET